jgi:hypothetical protein
VARRHAKEKRKKRENLLFDLFEYFFWPFLYNQSPPTLTKHLRIFFLLLFCVCCLFLTRLYPHSIRLGVSSKSFNMVDGTARLIEPPKGQAKLGVVFPSNSFSRPVPADGNYWVLDTDYTNYSIVWSCQTFNGKSIRKINIHFSRSTRQTI